MTDEAPEAHPDPLTALIAEADEWLAKDGALCVAGPLVERMADLLRAIPSLIAAAEANRQAALDYSNYRIKWDEFHDANVRWLRIVAPFRASREPGEPQPGEDETP